MVRNPIPVPESVGVEMAANLVRYFSRVGEEKKVLGGKKVEGMVAVREVKSEGNNDMERKRRSLGRF